MDRVPQLISGATMTMLTSGTGTITAFQAGNANHNPTAQVSQNTFIIVVAPSTPTASGSYERAHTKFVA